MSEKFTLTKIKAAIEKRCKDCGGRDEHCEDCYLLGPSTLDTVSKYCKKYCCNGNNPPDCCGAEDCSLYPIMMTLFEKKEIENG